MIVLHSEDQKLQFLNSNYYFFLDHLFSEIDHLNNMPTQALSKHTQKLFKLNIFYISLYLADGDACYCVFISEI